MFSMGRGADVYIPIAPDRPPTQQLIDEAKSKYYDFDYDKYVEREGVFNLLCSWLLQVEKN